MSIRSGRKYAVSVNASTCLVEIHLRIYEDDNNNLNHSFFISCFDKEEIYFFQTKQDNYPIYTSVYRHFNQLEEAGEISKNDWKYFFENKLAERDFFNLSEWIDIYIVPSYKRTENYKKLSSINDERINKYLISLLEIHEYEIVDITSSDFDMEFQARNKRIW